MAQNKVSVVIDGKEYISKEATKAGKSIEGVGHSSEKMAKMAKVAFAATAAAAAAMVAGLVAGSVKVSKLADEIDKTSQRLSMSRDTYQEWDYIMSQNGMTIDRLQSSMRTMNSETENAIKAGQDYINVTEGVTVAIRDADGQLRKQGDVLLDTIESLAGMEDETERNLRANRLLGRSYIDLLPLLNSGADGIEDLRQKAHDLGIVLDDDVIDAGVRLTDTMDTMRRTWQAVGARALLPVIELMDDLGTKFLELAKEGGPIERIVGTLVRWISWGMDMIPKFSAVFTFLFSAMGIGARYGAAELQKLWDKIKEMPILKDIIAKIETYLEMSGEVFEALKAGDWKKFWELTAPMVKDGLTIAAVIGTAGIVGSSIWTTVGSALQKGGFLLAGIKGIGIGGVIAGMSLVLAIAETIADPEKGWGDFAKNVGLALAGAFAAGVLTGNPAVGFMVFTIMLNFKVGEKLKDAQELYTGAGFGAGGISDIINVPAVQNQVQEVERIVNMLGINVREKLIKIYKDTDIGREFIHGMGLALDDLEKMSFVAARDMLQAMRDELGIKSPSKEGEYMGLMLVRGMIEGIKNEGMRTELLSEFDSMMEALKSSASVDIDATIKGIMGTGGTGGEPDEAAGGFLQTLKSAVGPLMDMVTSMSSVVAIMDPLGVIFSGIMDVLGPAIDSILKPVLGVLRIIGQTVGKILLPVFEGLGLVAEFLGKAFVWVYNKGIMPFANALITVGNVVYNGFVAVIRGIISAINKIPGVRISRPGYRSLDQGHLEAISYEDIARAGEQSGGDYAGSARGSSTSVQQLTINQTFHFEGPVIGEGGMEQVGGFVVRAIQAYSGMGGTVKLVEA